MLSLQFVNMSLPVIEYIRKSCEIEDFNTSDDLSVYKGCIESKAQFVGDLFNNFR